MGKRKLSASTSDVTIEPRKVDFDLSRTPLEWLPGQPFASQLINAAHLFVPEGEFTFCRLFNQALPYVTDDKLRQDIKAFIRQEAMHARTHENAVSHYLERHGIETAAYTRRMQWLFGEGPLGDKPFGMHLPKRLDYQWLLFRIGMIAALEHTTCVFGNYLLNHTDHWDDMGADPELVSLLRWHGAEEIEHRCVAFDLYQHLGGRYPTRYFLKVLQMGALSYLMVSGTNLILDQMPHATGKTNNVARWRSWYRSAKDGAIPGLGWTFKQEFRFLSPWYHPRNEANTQDALDYLSTSNGIISKAGSV